jgi:anti-sigma B factor antagonist
MLLDLDITSNPRATVLRVGGEVDVASAAELRDCLHQVIQARPGRLVVDLGQVGFIDSVGLGVLVAAHRRLRSLGEGSVMQVVCADGLTQRILRVTGLDRVFPVHATVAQALADLPSPEPA